jgi:hypothetical protein
VIGGHHLIDIVAGLAIAGPTILTLEWLDRAASASSASPQVAAATGTTSVPSQ